MTFFEMSQEYHDLRFKGITTESEHVTLTLERVGVRVLKDRRLIHKY